MVGEYDFSEEKLRDTLDILPPKKAPLQKGENGKGKYRRENRSRSDH